MAIDDHGSYGGGADAHGGDGENAIPFDRRDRLIEELERHRTELANQNRQLRETQHKLEASNARYANLYDFAPIAYCTFDRSGRITELNLAGATLLEGDRRQLLGMPLVRFVARDERALFLQHLTRCAEGLGEVTAELAMVGGKGARRTVQMVSVPSCDPVSGGPWYRTVMTDIEKRKRAEEALRLSIRMREDFLAIVSHDLRNPLNSIVMGAELLLRTGPAEERRRFGRRHLEAVRRAAGRMNRLLSDLLDLSSMDAGQLSMARGVHEVEDILSAVVEIWRPQAAEKQVELESRLDGDRPTVYCDRERTIQALLNLAGNAVKFTPAGGRVTIEAEVQADHVRFRVRDTGCGIAPDHLAQIFDPYWQVEKSAKKGTGLGLSIARGIAECHGAMLVVQSTPGQGSTFSFALPRIAPALAAPSTTSSAAFDDADLSAALLEHGEPVERRCVLLVEDEDDARETLAQLLESAGYEVVTAGDGEEALRVAHVHGERIAIILLDLVMPVMDGWQFLARRAADPALARLPVVLISGQVDAPETAERFAIAGYAEKPLDVSTLLRKVELHARPLGAHCPH